MVLFARTSRAYYYYCCCFYNPAKKKTKHTTKSTLGTVGDVRFFLRFCVRAVLGKEKEVYKENDKYCF